MRHPAYLLLGAILALAVPSRGACAPADDNAPETTRVPKAAARVVASFDFEEPGNPLPVPRGWVRGQSDPASGIDRPGFPVWNGAEFDEQAPARSGRASVRLPVKGGSASLRIAPGIVPIFPSADYTVSASVRTDPAMRHARAVLAARQLDDRGNPIPGSEVRTAPISTLGAWRRIAVNVLADRTSAAFLQVELMVLQPEQIAAGEPRRPFAVWQEDYDASAWFDDVLIVQRPRLDLTTDEPGNIVLAPKTPTLHVGVRDLAGEALTIRVAVYDLDGNELDERVIEPGGGRFESEWQPGLVEFGWHRATLDVAADGVPIARETCDFLWLPHDERPAVRRPTLDRRTAGPHRFGVRVGPMPASVRAQTSGIARALGAGSVSMPVWAMTADEDPERAVASLTGVVEALHNDLREITLEIPEMPARVAAVAGSDPSDVAGVLRADRPVWGATLDPFFDRFGQRVRRWQIGSPEVGWQSGSGAFAADLNDVALALASLVPGPIVSVPWRWDAEPHPALGALPTTTVVRLDPGVPPDGVRELVASWSDRVSGARRNAVSEPPELALAISAPSAAPHGAWGGAAFARTITGVWHALNQNAAADPINLRMLLDDAWTVRNARRPKIEPTPASGVWRTLTNAFEGRADVRELDLLPDARTILLAPGEHGDASRGAALVAWRVPGADAGTHEILLGGSDVYAIDLFGNFRPIDLIADDPATPPAHRLELTGEPVVIEGVDAELLRFLASVRLEPGLVRATPGAHAHALVFDNPWSFPLRGRFFILEPGGHSSDDTPIDRTWVIGPRVSEFAAAGGAEGRVPLSIAFGAAQKTGARELVVDFQLGGSAGRGVRARRTFELGIEDLRMTAYERAGPGIGDDVILQVEVTNLSGEPRTIDLVGVAAGQPKARASIASLEAGRTAVRALVFYGARDELQGGDAIVGLSLQDQPGRMNVAVPVARRAD
ncbi:MAG: hypothetical protein RIB60_10000 [Phycisphaerales bacterium]